MSTKNKYRISLPQNHLQRIDITSPAHLGNLRNAIDFIVPHNTPFLASADGTVSYVKDDSKVGSKSVILELFQFYCNYAPK